MKLYHYKSKIFQIGIIFIFIFNFYNVFSLNSINFTSALDSNDYNDIINSLPRQSTSNNLSDWEQVQYEMLLICPNDSEFIAASQEFADWKTFRGIPTLVVSNYTNFNGTDVPEKIRNAIIHYYNIFPIQWVLLMGDADGTDPIIPIRYVRNEDTKAVEGSPESVGDSTIKPTDYYYAELTANWNIDNDIYWGEDSKYTLNSDEPELDYNPEVYVGRFPADNAQELQNMIEKTIIYEKADNAGSWMNRYLGLSGISDPTGTIGDSDGEDEAVVGQYLIDNYIEKNMNWTHYIQHTSNYVPLDDPRVSSLSKSKTINAINNGVSIIGYAGHGDQNGFSAAAALRSGDVSGLNNYNMTSLIYADACTTNSYDYDCLGENFVKSPSTGGIGYIGALRFSWYYPNDTLLEADNRYLFRQYFHEMFENGYYQQGKALYESKISYVNTSWFQFTNNEDGFKYFEMERKSLLTYMLLGDPSVDIYTKNPERFNPLFPENTNIYEGSKYSIILTSESGNPVPNARLMLKSENGKYNIFNANDNGVVSFILPLGADISFQYSLFAHNMIYKSGIFESKTDNFSPNIKIQEIDPVKPSANDEVDIFIDIDDDGIGLCYGYLLISSTNFENYSIYSMESTGLVNQYSVKLPKLIPDTYKYNIVAFDYVGNFNSTFGLEGEYSIRIRLPAQIFLLFGINLVVVSLVLVSITTIIIKVKKLTNKTDLDGITISPNYKLNKK